MTKEIDWWGGPLIQEKLNDIVDYDHDACRWWKTEVDIIIFHWEMFLVVKSEHYKHFETRFDFTIPTLFNITDLKCWFQLPLNAQLFWSLL